MASGITTRKLLRRTPQRQRGRERVQALLTAAAAMFVEKGFDAATMTEIAGRAGASIGSLYLFFPTKQALAQALVTALADSLSLRLAELRARTAGWAAPAIADALFAELARFLDAHPVYAVLIELPGEDGWRHAVRMRRRCEIAALFAAAQPPLPAGQAELLAVIVPQLMRLPLVVGSDSAALRGAVLEELRAMLHHHLARPAQTPS